MIDDDADDVDHDEYMYIYNQWLTVKDKRIFDGTFLPILQGFVQQGVQGFVMKPIPHQVELTPEQKALFPELTELRQQIENLQVNCSKC